MNKIGLSLLFILLQITGTAQKNKWKLRWSDEFNYTGLPDSAKWGYESGLVRNKEPQYYTVKRAENCRVEEGNLIIEARKEDYRGAGYTSASIVTLGKKAFRYGRIEVRAKVPKGLGSWPAIWMMGVNRAEVKWPHCGEIDIMEFVGKDSNLVYGTVHYSNNEQKYEMKGVKPVMGAPYDDFHVYAIERTKEEIAFFYDDKKYFVFSLAAADKATRSIFEKQFYLLLNLALGNKENLGGLLNPDILPLRYYVDYVRVYE